MIRPIKLGRSRVSSLVSAVVVLLFCVLTTQSASALSPHSTPSIESGGMRGYCIDDHGDYLRPQNFVVSSKCNGTYGEYWRYDNASKQIVFQHNDSYCLIPLNRSSATQVPVVLGQCRGNGVYWNEYKGGYQNRMDHLCITAMGPNNLLRQEKCTGKAAQKWQDPLFAINPNLCGNVVTANPTQAECIAKDLMQVYPYYWNPNEPVEVTGQQSTSTQWVCLANLWGDESGWRRTAENPSSGAYGIPQSDPGSKYVSDGYPTAWYYEAGVNPSGESSAIAQIEWGLNYIAGRYATPCGAMGHENTYHWYVVNTQSN